MPQYDDKGRLTRAGAEQVIREGGSISRGNRLYNTVESLPSEAEFAKGDPAAEKAARDRLLAQRRALDAELDSLDAAAKAKPQPAANAAK